MRNDETLNIGFLGGAYNSAVGRAHYAAIKIDNIYKLSAGCFSRNEEINQSTAVKYGIPPNRVYGSLVEMLEHDKNKIDAVVLLTPTDQHENHINTCLRARMPVICEKSFVASVNEAKKVKQMKDDHKGFVAVTLNYTGYPMVREMQEMIRSNKLGKIQQIHIEMPQEGFLRYNENDSPIVPQEWRLKDIKVPVISLDLGVHLHAIIKFLTGEIPLELISTCDSFGNFNQIMDNVICTAKYTNNMVANIWYSKTALGYRNGLKIRVFGNDGACEWYQENSEQIKYTDKKGNRTIIDRGSSSIKIANKYRYTRFKAGHPSGFIEAFANYYYDVGKALKHYINNSKKVESLDSYVFGVDECLEGLKMLEAISLSSNKKAWVTIDD